MADLIFNCTGMKPDSRLLIDIFGEFGEAICIQQ